MQQAYLIIDIGTGNSRTAVVSAEGEILSMAKENSVVHNDYRVRSAQYFKTEEWEQTILRLSRQAVEAAGAVEVTAVCAVTLREGIALIGHDGRSLVGYTNADRRGEPYMQKLNWERIWELTGLNPSPIFSAIKILGAMHLDPELMEQTKTYTSVSDWIGFLFTGRCVWERAQAAQSAVYDMAKGCWSEELCDLIGIDGTKLPPLADAGTILGPVKPELISQLGLAESAVFVVGTADTQAALSATDAQVGQTVIVSGTTSPSCRITETFQPHPLSWISPTAERDRYMLEINTSSCGINLQRFKDLMLKDLPYDELNADAVRRGLPEKGLPEMLACFSPGMHLDYMGPDGGFVMRSPLNVDLKPADFFHALTLNVAMSIVMCLRRMKRLVGFEQEYLIGCGGGFASPVVGQCVADLIEMPIRVYDTYREATVYGGVALCRRAFGLPQLPKRILQEIQPKRSEALVDYFRQWEQCRGQFQQMKF